MVEKKIYYAKKFICSFDKTEFQWFRLYPSAREKFERMDETFEFTIYVNETGAANFVDFLLLEVKTCPSCYFSSNDDDVFAPRFSERIDRRVFDIIMQTKSQRQEMIKGAKDFFSDFRDYMDAIISYQVAISSSQSLYDANPVAFAHELVRCGNYAFKVSHLYKQNNQIDQQEKWLKIAYENITMACQASLTGALYYRTLYQLVATALYFKEEHVATKCIDTLMKIERETKDKDALKYLNRARDLWQSRK